jgi:hypothetical protein
LQPHPGAVRTIPKTGRGDIAATRRAANIGLPACGNAAAELLAGHVGKARGAAAPALQRLRVVGETFAPFALKSLIIRKPSAPCAASVTCSCRQRIERAAARVVSLRYR